jgi:hypothetical protein
MTKLVHVYFIYTVGQGLVGDKRVNIFKPDSKTSFFLKREKVS